MNEVKEDELSVSTLEDETIEVEHLFAEPKTEHVSVDGVLSFGDVSLGKRLHIEDFSCGFEYGLTNNGGLDSNATQEGEDLQLDVLDGLLDEIDEVDDLDATNGLSNACECDDFLLDIEFAENGTKLDLGHSKGSRLGNSSSESRSPGLSGSSNGAVGISESSSVTILESECKNDALNKTATCKLHGGLVSKCGCRPQDEDSIHSTSLELRKVDDLNSGKNLLACGISSAGGEKRLRKPTRRYIEEFSDKKLDFMKRGEKYSAGMRRRALTVIPEEKSLGGISVPAVSQFRGWQGRPKKQKQEIESDKELVSSESEDDRVTKKISIKHDRRKHQRMWTPSEVIKLVDGISEHGVGRWTDIKRLLFSTSAYRTPIDLRDKWRNLLRASGAQKPNKKGVEQKQEHSLRPLPSSLLRRVLELAKIHPYPRVRISKNLCVGQVTPAMVPSASKGAPPSLGGRAVRRKNYN
ncbi:uncharacterized protein LOC121266168 isoform X2 [Juglans microcarpa x Juglans regia]|uniref:uncharacterized protein LOC121266168 isoform X2 n=1 Tax=Juglans microcarpa x Juglans regia TaxID=2249226 RepID=UPI001B7E6B5A|nr:uncharacterized protein LOC121266168 isoform X2 [Juglans microcarpa x Juglans regia]